MKKILKHFKKNWYRYGLETLVVVNGVLIAFALNNWNESKKARIVEREFLTDLREDLKRNIELADEDWNARSEVSCNIILDVIRNNKPYNDSMELHFHNSRIFSEPIISNSAYEAIKNKGFELIKSKMLRKEIIDHFELLIKRMVERQNRIERSQRPYLKTFIYENFESVDTSNIRLRPNNFEELVDNQIYINLLTQRRNFQRMNLDMKIEYLEDCNSLIQLIDLELSK